MMQSVSHHVTANRRTIPLEAGRLDEAARERLTPAERIALTIALLNRGLDLMGGFARTSLQGAVPGPLRGITTSIRSATPSGRTDRV
jgi:hypothetical protein